LGGLKKKTGGGHQNPKRLKWGTESRPAEMHLASRSFREGLKRFSTGKKSGGGVKQSQKRKKKMKNSGREETTSPYAMQTR